MNRINFKRGFTLLELMIVVAIIAILTSVVLVALNSARSKGGDAGVKANIHTVANQAELFLTGNNSYLPAGGTAIGITTPCPTYVSGGTNMFSNNKPLADALAQAVSNGGNGSSCYNSATNWSVAVGLSTNSSTSWCMDNTGISKQEAFAPGSAISTTTNLCK